MRSNLALLASALCLCLCNLAAAGNLHKIVPLKDRNAPFGFVVSTSRTSGDDYALTGGKASAKPRRVVLTATGDDKAAIERAILNNDIVILDGSKGDFILSSSIHLDSIRNKSVMGINHARLRTGFSLNKALIDRLDSYNLNQWSEHSNTGGYLFVTPSDPKSLVRYDRKTPETQMWGEDYYRKVGRNMLINEDRERHTHRAMIEIFNDPEETFRHAGIFNIAGCENLIFRNLSFIGPGAVDIGGDDLMTLRSGTRHVWVDHCLFQDGMDGNMDIVVKSDLITVSWCIFRYSENSFSHRYSNLIASSDVEAHQGSDNFNITFACNMWGSSEEGSRRVDSRTPMARFAMVHMLNNYLNTSSSRDKINPRQKCLFRVENNYCCTSGGWFNMNFQSSVSGLTICGNLMGTDADSIGSGVRIGAEVVMPYSYVAADASEVKRVVGALAGPTLKNPEKIGK